MSRLIYGADPQGPTSYLGAAAGLKAVAFWTAQSVAGGGAGGTQITDLQNAAGGAISTVTSLGDGSMPQFSGPNSGQGSSTAPGMWADAGGLIRLFYNPQGSGGSGGGGGTAAGFLMFDTAKTASFTAAASTGYDCDLTSASVTATAVAGPADGTQIFLNISAQGGTHTATFAPGAGDTVQSGDTTVFTGLHAKVTWQYDASTKIWRITSQSIPPAVLLANTALTGNPTASTQAPLDDSTRVATTAYVDAAVAALAGTLGALAFLTPSGTPTATTFYAGDNSWKNQPAAFEVSQQTAAIATSEPQRIGANCTVTEVSLVCATAPVGSSLTYVLQVSTDGGSTWPTVQSISISAGSTAMVTASPNYAITAPALLRVNVTSVGSTTAATGVLLQADLG